MGDMPREECDARDGRGKIVSGARRGLGACGGEDLQALTQEAELTPAECFVVCLRAAAKFLAQYSKKEWRDIVKHASELLLQHAALYKQSERQERLR
jgi:hypothetical protein